MKIDRFSFKVADDNTSDKLMKAIEALPENTFKGLHSKDKASVELIIDGGVEIVEVSSPYPYGDGIKVNHSSEFENQLSWREWTAFSYKGINYRVRY